MPQGSATTPVTSITATPAISVSGGNITAAVSASQSVTPTISAGYVTSGTPGTVTASGSKSVAATSLDANLVAGNIKKNITIFGVTGTYEESGSAIEVTQTPDSHGGTIIEINGVVAIPMNPWLMRGDVQKVYTLTYDKHIVADEKATIPAYTTTSTSLKASETISPTVTYNPTDYNYLVAVRTLTIPEYSVTTKAKGRLEYSYANALYELVDYPANTI